MAWVVLTVWALEGAAGLWLFVQWLRGRRVKARLLLTHVVGVNVALALWVAFLATDDVAWGWVAFGVLNVSIGFGDAFMLARPGRPRRTVRQVARDYVAYLSAALRFRLPLVTSFHAVFAGVVFACALVACIQAT